MAASSIAPYTGREEPPSRCAECSEVLVDALVLSCGHDLCLRCAGNALRSTSSLKGRTVACSVCRERTQLCEEAAATLVAQPVPSLQAPTGRAFGLVDRDHDGIIARSEWNAALQLAGTPIWGVQGPGPGPLASGSRWGSAAGQQPAYRLDLQAPRAPLQLYGESWPCGGGPGDAGVGRAARLTSRAPSEADGFAGLVGTPPRGGHGDGGLQGRSAQPQACRRHPAAGSQPQQDAAVAEAPSPWHGRLAHIPRCPDHPEEQATYFCGTCECSCICAECVVQKTGRHYDHEVVRVSHAHEKLKARAGHLLDEAVSMEDQLVSIMERVQLRHKDIGKKVVRGRATVRGAFERVRQELADREAQLLTALDSYESESLGKLSCGYAEHMDRLVELQRLQASLRTQCRTGDAVQALNTYAAAKRAIKSLGLAFQKEEFPGAPERADEFSGLAGSARMELDLHREGLASLEEAVHALCSR